MNAIGVFAISLGVSITSYVGQPNFVTNFILDVLNSGVKSEFMEGTFCDFT